MPKHGQPVKQKIDRIRRYVNRMASVVYATMLSQHPSLAIHGETLWGGSAREIRSLGVPSGAKKWIEVWIEARELRSVGYEIVDLAIAVTSAQEERDFPESFWKRQG